jgi:hypothetical protein
MITSASSDTVSMTLTVIEAFCDAEPGTIPRNSDWWDNEFSVRLTLGADGAPAFFWSALSLIDPHFDMWYDRSENLSHLF